MSLLQYISVRTGLLAGIPPLPPPVPPAVPDPPPRHYGGSLVNRDVTVIQTPEPQIPEPVLTAADDDYEDGSNQKAARNQFRARTVKGANNGVALRQYAEATLGGGSLRKVVKLPEGEDENEWLAVNSEYHPEELRGGPKETAQLTRPKCSGRLLQPDQPPLRRYYRILLASIMPRDEGNRRVRVLVAGQ